MTTKNEIGETESTTPEQKASDKLVVKITKDVGVQRIFVEFSTEDGKIVLQKSFQNNVNGIISLEIFEKSIKSVKDLKKYFGLNVSKTQAGE